MVGKAQGPKQAVFLGDVHASENGVLSLSLGALLFLHSPVNLAQKPLLG